MKSCFCLVISPITALAFVLGMSGPVYGHQQNQTCDGPQGPACAPNESPMPVRWARGCVSVYLDEGGSEDDIGTVDEVASTNLEQLVEAAFDTWTQPGCTGLSIRYAGTVDPAAAGESDNVVVFKRDEWPGVSDSTFASTVVSYDAESGEIQQADIEVNDRFHEFAIGQAPTRNQADLANTLTHEAGHFIGMGHSALEPATMFGGAQLGETKKRTLHQDDIDGLCAHYPRQGNAGACPDDSDAHDGGSGAFDWGKDEPGEDAAACSVTRLAGSSILSPIVFIIGLLGGVWWRRRMRRSSEG